MVCGLLRARDGPRENIFSFQLTYDFALMLKPGGLKAGRFSATTSSQQARAGRKTHADIVLDKKPALDLPPGSI